MSEFATEQVVPSEPAELEVEPEVPAWTGPSQEEWTAVVSDLQARQQAEWEAQQAELRQQGELDLDPFNENFGQNLRAFLQQQAQAAVQPVTEWQRQQAEASAYELAQDMVHDAMVKGGDYLFPDEGKAAVHRAADEYYAEAAAQYGPGQKAVQAAIDRADKEYRDWEKRVGQAYHEREMNVLTNLSGAGREPSAGAVAAQQVVTTPGGDELSLVRKYGGQPF